MVNLAVFISGFGSNAQAISQYFEGHKSIAIKLLVSNNAASPALAWFKDAGIRTLVIQNEDLKNEDWLFDQLRDAKIDGIVLAGFLRKIPQFLCKAFPNKILNIHPALLPKFGGKGMYGIHVHQAVVEAGETKSGITIHLVNEAYDEGQILAQHTVSVPQAASPQRLMQEIQVLEHQFYPVEIEKYFTHVF